MLTFIAVLLAGGAYIITEPTASPVPINAGPSTAPGVTASPSGSPMPSASFTSVATATPAARPDERAFLERAFTDRLLFLLRIAIVVAGAFLVAAVVQRAVLAEFAGKLGPIEIPALAEAGAVTSAQLTDLSKQTTEALTKERELNVALTLAVIGVEQRMDQLVAALDRMEARVDALEKKS